MLDDLAYIHQKDAKDALGTVSRQWQQLGETFRPSIELAAVDYQNVVVAGMGGSALPALLAQSWLTIKVPFEVVRNYELPAFVGPSSLVICSSYSGNTEETLAALEAARSARAQIVIVAAGGKLQDLAKQYKLPFILLPKIDQPRYATLAGFKVLVSLLQQADLLIDGQQVVDQLPQVAQFMKTSVEAWQPTVATKANQAKQIAQELMGKSIVVYSGPKLSPVAYKWKISFNENAKHVAWVNQLPEFNHNEFIGWSKQPVNKPYAVIDLRSKMENPRIQKRFEVSARLLSGLRPEPIVVEAQGKTLAEQLVWTAALGDFVSIYLALLGGINPSPVDLVEKFKLALND
ncbi:MAG: bifunctional phosphoglucose/phosphomannose isomerase [Candidatus Saccharimonadales bacterium]